MKSMTIAARNLINAEKEYLAIEKCLKAINSKLQNAKKKVNYIDLVNITLDDNFRDYETLLAERTRGAIK